jgi:cell division septum initiation protein DivIVA
MQQPAEKRLPLPMSPQLAAETGSAAVSIAARWQEELMRFSLLRMNRYCDFSQRIRQCRSPGDLLAIQSAFFQQMLADYGTESRSMLRDLFHDLPQGPAGEPAPAAQSYETMILEAQHDAARIIDMAKEQAQRIVGEAQSRASRRNGSGRNPRRAASA